MELWSLIHFLMPAVFSSHSDFKEWFSNLLTGIVEASQEYNSLIQKAGGPGYEARSTMTLSSGGGIRYVCVVKGGCVESCGRVTVMKDT